MAIGTTCVESTATQFRKSPPATAPAPFPAGTAYLLTLAAALSSGALLWMCFQPLAWGFLGWIALVPFLLLVRSQARPWLVYLAAWLCGAVFFFPTLQWMRVADYRMIATWLALAFYCSLYLPAALWMIRRLDRCRLPLVITFPLVWIALEYFRSFFLTGFAWYLLAHTQHEFLAMIQITDLGGVYLVSLLVAAVNAIVFEFAYQFPEIRRWFNQTELSPYQHYSSLEILNRSFFADLFFRRNLILEGIAVCLLLAASYSYGAYRLAEYHFTEGPTVCLLQSSVDQRIRNEAWLAENGAEPIETMQQQFSALCTRVVRDLYPPPALIIWPETSFPHKWTEVSPDMPIAQVPIDWRNKEIAMRNMLHDLGARYTRIPHLLGMNSEYLAAPKSSHQYNSAVLINEQGRIEGRFDKMHRVPFGEYVPFKDWLPFMKQFAPYDYDFGIESGEKFTRFKLGKYYFGALICFEDTDPFIARRYLAQTNDGPAVDFLVNISNDGWFDGSSEHEEHLAVSRFRAIECRRAMVRSVNMGVSALIDSNGRIVKPELYPAGTPPVWVARQTRAGGPELAQPDWHKFKKVSGIIAATIPIDDRFSFYTVAGDWLPLSCWSMILAIAGWSCWRRRAVPLR